MPPTVSSPTLAAPSQAFVAIAIAKADGSLADDCEIQLISKDGAAPLLHSLAVASRGLTASKHCTGGPTVEPWPPYLGRPTLAAPAPLSLAFSQAYGP